MPETKEFSEEAKRLAARYHQLAHAVQSGVAYKMNYSPNETQPKHLRTGINMAMCEHSALAGLLIEKGVITHEEYLGAIVSKLEEEVASYERQISETIGGPVRLG